MITTQYKRFDYEKAKAFFDVLEAHKNEDDYVVCSANYAGLKAGLHPAMANLLPKRLAAIGCLRLYQTPLEEVTDKDGRVVRQGGKTFTLMKIVKPLTEELWPEGFIEKTVTMTIRSFKESAS